MCHPVREIGWLPLDHAVFLHEVCDFDDTVYSFLVIFYPSRFFESRFAMRKDPHRGEGVFEVRILTG